MLNGKKLDIVLNYKKDVLEISKEIDRLVHKNYELWKTNYMAHDLLYDDNKYKSFYTWNEMDDFKKYLSKSSNKDIYYRMLKLYVNPILNKLTLGYCQV